MKNNNDTLRVVKLFNFDLCVQHDLHQFSSISYIIFIYHLGSEKWKKSQQQQQRWNLIKFIECRSAFLDIYLIYLFFGVRSGSTCKAIIVHGTTEVIRALVVFRMHSACVCFGYIFTMRFLCVSCICTHAVNKPLPKTSFFSLLLKYVFIDPWMRKRYTCCRILFPTFLYSSFSSFLLVFTTLLEVFRFEIRLFYFLSSSRCDETILNPFLNGKTFGREIFELFEKNYNLSTSDELYATHSFYRFENYESKIFTL